MRHNAEKNVLFRRHRFDERLFCSDEFCARLDGRRPVAHVLVLVEDEAVRARPVVLDGALADEVHGAVVLVPVEAHLLSML